MLENIKNLALALFITFFGLGAIILGIDSMKYSQAPEKTEVTAFLSGKLVDGPCAAQVCQDLHVTLSTAEQNYEALLSHESVAWLKQYLKVESLENAAQTLKVRFHKDKIAFKISELNSQKVAEPAPWFYIKK